MAGSGFGVLREHASRLDVNGIVQQIERLQRSVRDRSIDGALFARWCIEIQQAGVQICALPGRVEATAIEIRPVPAEYSRFGKLSAAR